MRIAPKPMPGQQISLDELLKSAPNLNKGEFSVERDEKDPDVFLARNVRVHPHDDGPDRISLQINIPEKPFYGTQSALSFGKPNDWRVPIAPELYGLMETLYEESLNGKSSMPSTLLQGRIASLIKGKGIWTASSVTYETEGNEDRIEHQFGYANTDGDEPYFFAEEFAGIPIVAGIEKVPGKGLLAKEFCRCLLGTFDIPQIANVYRSYSGWDFKLVRNLETPTQSIKCPVIFKDIEIVAWLSEPQSNFIYIKKVTQ